ncbi:MAG: membrane protein insertase YidC [Patescibacteria group bacterium]|nr:membrane protein insertase YidC [Patescibacteria group bacterium]
MTYFWDQIFYRPILNVLIFFYNTIALRDFGLAIIFVTLLLRLILYPFFHKGTKHQMMMQRLQPKIKKIQETHKHDKQKQSEELMALYKEHGVNPFLGILLLIIQIPIMIALYWVVRMALAGGQLTGLYSFIHAPRSINAYFLGIFNLAQPSFILIFLAALAQYFQARLAIWRNPDQSIAPSPAEKMAQQMAFIGPILTILIFYGLPAAIGLYWLVTSIFSIIQQIIVNRHLREKFGN